MKFFELYIALAFVAAWIILELVAKRFDKPPEKPKIDKPPLAKHDDEKPEIKRSQY